MHCLVNRGQHKIDETAEVLKPPSPTPPDLRVLGKGKMGVPGRVKIIEILNQEVNSATARLTEASRKVDVIIDEVPGGLPQPDGLHRIDKAISERNKAREALKLALKRNCDFALYRIIPEDLK
jgi:hypothetical protein